MPPWNRRAAAQPATLPRWFRFCRLRRRARLRLWQIPPINPPKLARIVICWSNVCQVAPSSCARRRPPPAVYSGMYCVHNVRCNRRKPRLRGWLISSSGVTPDCADRLLRGRRPAARTSLAKKGRDGARFWVHGVLSWPFVGQRISHFWDRLSAWRRCWPQG